MSILTQLWNTVTAPQATIISAVLTLVTAIVGVLLGWSLFGDRVKDLKSAVTAADSILNDHKTNVERLLAQIYEKISSLDVQAAATQASLGSLSGSMNDFQSASGGLQGGSSQERSLEQVPDREKLRENWAAIRDWIEQQAANPEIDGRTRAKYARIDRRQYLDLIDALDSDSQLGMHSQNYREALAIWQKYRTGRLVPTAADADRMSDLRHQITGQSS